MTNGWSELPNVRLLIIQLLQINMSVPNEQDLSSIPSNALRDIFIEDFPQQKVCYQKLSQNKGESDIDQIQATSPSQNSPIDQSNIFQEDRKRCNNCRHMQTRIDQMNVQLTNQRKRNIKYVKIINAKTQKEKQLQIAYGQIVRQLKKQIEAAHTQNAAQRSPTYSNRQQFNLNSMREQLSQMESQLKEKNEQISILMSKAEEGQQLLNLSQKKSKVMSLYHNLSNVNILSTSGKRVSAFKIFHYPIVVPVQNLPKFVKENEFSFEEQTSQQKYLSIRKGEKDSQIVQNYIFQKDNNSLHLSEIEARQTATKKQEVDSQQYKTVMECSSSQNYHSIHSNTSSAMFIQNMSAINQTDPVLEKSQSQQIPRGSYCSIAQPNLTISQISDVSMQEELINRHSDKELLDSILSTGNHVPEQKIEKPSNKFGIFTISKQIQLERKPSSKIHTESSQWFQMVALIQSFLERFVAKINLYGQKYNAHIQPFKKKLLLQESSSNCLRASWKVQIEEAIKAMVEQVQKIFKCQRRQYQKLLNDRQLQSCDLQNKFYELNKEKQEMLTVIENYQLQKSLMEIRLLQFQEDENTSLSAFKMSSKSIGMIESIKKKISSNKSQKVKSQEVQCCILSPDLITVCGVLQQRNFELMEALNCLPNYLNNLSETHEGGQGYSINFGEKLNGQIETMLQNSFQMILSKSKEIQRQILFKKVRSSSVSLTTYKRKESQQSQTASLLQAQNQQLKASLKKKTEELLKCSEKYTLQNIDKLNCEKIIQNLKIQLFSLKKVLQNRQSPNSESKLQNMESVSIVLSPTKQNISLNGQFLDYEDKKEYNNLYWDRDIQVMELKEKLIQYQALLVKCKNQHKKKKPIIYINN